MNVLTWNGYDINDDVSYVTGLTSPVLGNAPVQAQTVARHGRFPLVGGVARPDRVFMLTVIVVSATPDTARASLRTIFETESGEIKTLVIEGDDGTEQYVQAVCEAFYEEDEVGNVFFAMLRVHDDPSWQSTALQTDTETVTASDQEWTITNAGDQIARPTITITPTTTQPNTNAYRRFVAVNWRGDGAANYPTDIMNNAFDTAALVTGSKMQADGDDIRVLVNGVAVDYWLDDINTDNTSVWVSLNWQKAVPMTLAAAVAASGSVETIDVNEAIDALPSSGILLIESELFLYSSKNNSLKRFTILARAAHGTAEGGHSASTAVAWIQHRIEVQYGNSSLTSYPSLARTEPIFDLTASTNAVWDYLDFGEISAPAELPVWQRPGTWQRAPSYALANGRYLYTPYTESQYTTAPTGDPYSANPYEVIGLYESFAQPITWTLIAPYPITRANFQDGYKRAEDSLSAWNASVQSRSNNGFLVTEYAVPVPTLAATWQAWSQDIDPLGLSSANTIILSLAPTATLADAHYVEAGRVTLEFDTDYTPTVYLAPEQGNYTIDATLTHVESGWALKISYAGGIDVSLIINTDNGEVTTTADGSNQFQAVRRFPRPRVEWLPLLPGTNTLKWTEVGVVEVDVTFEWRERRGA